MKLENNLEELDMSFKHWEECSLEDLTVSIFSGGTPKTSEPSFWNGEYNWLSSGETRNRFIRNTEKTITLDGVEKSSTKLAEIEDVVIASAGQGNTRGQVSFCKINTYINQSVISLRCNTKKLYPLYLFYNLSSRYNEIRKISDGSSIRGSLTTKMMKQFKINLPSLTEQKAIADILSSLDDKIELNNQMNETLEEMAQALFKRWFVDFEFPNEKGQPYKSSGGEMVESELGMIPKEFKIMELGDCLEKIVDNRGKTPPQSEKGISLIEGYNISMFNSFITKSTKKQKYVSLKTYNEWFRSGHPRKGDILCATVGTLPKWCFVGEKDEICIAQNIIALRSNENIISSFYLKHFMDTNYFIQTFNGRVVTTAQPSIKVGHMTTIRLYIPQRDIISMFDEIVIPIYEQIEHLNLQNKSLELIRDSLLPKLMSGEIRVSDLC